MGLFSTKQSATQTPTTATDQARALSSGALLAGDFAFGDHNVTFGAGSSIDADGTNGLQTLVWIGGGIAAAWLLWNFLKRKGGS